MTIREVGLLANEAAQRICEVLLPNGKRVGRQWVVGDVAGSAGDSMAVELEGPKQGQWYDHAAGTGGDMLKLIEHNKGLKGVIAAADEARKILGLPEWRPDPKRSQAPAAPAYDPCTKAWRLKHNQEWVHPTKSWAYTDASGAIVAYVCRIDWSEGGKAKKDVLPQRVGEDGKWHWKGFKGDEKRPLYGLHRLTKQNDGRTLLIVEGEKTADAAAKILPAACVTTWMGGCKNVSKADWEPVTNWRGAVVVWPDNDDEGQSAAIYLQGRFPKARKVVLPDGLPPKWDLADPVPDGVSLQGLFDAALSGGQREAEAPTNGQADQPVIPAVYDSGRRAWWTKNGRGSWIEVSETGVRRLLKSQGYSAEKWPGALLSPLDAELLRLQREEDVAFAGAIAGWSEGIHEQTCGRILVVSEANLRWSAGANRGVYGTTNKILLNMLGELQFAVFMSWLHVRRDALLRGTWSPGQVLALCGPALCGKSLCQSIISLVLGGREAKPWRYMTGATDFNGELFGAEHLVIEDEAASTDIRARRHFGAHLKSMLFARSQSCHAKNRQAITLQPIWALSVSVNDEPENLMVLPPLDESLADKIILLRCERHPMPVRADTVAGQERLRAAIEEELPAFAAAVDAFEIPFDLRDERCGVIAYHHPELLAALESLAPETRLLELIDEVIFAPNPARCEWKGLSAELARELHSSDACRREAERLLHFRDACGTYLGRLAKRRPERVNRNVLDGHNRWTIRRAT